MWSRCQGFRVGAGIEVGELRGVRLAHDDGAGIAQTGNRGGVEIGCVVGEGRCAETCRETGDVNDVLDADRDAPEGTRGLAATDGFGEVVGLPQGAFAVDFNPGVDLILDGVDAGKSLHDDVDGGEDTVAHGGGDFAG